MPVVLSVTQWTPSMGPQGAKVEWSRSSVILNGRLPMKMRDEESTGGAAEEAEEERAEDVEPAGSVPTYDTQRNASAHRDGGEK